MVECKSCSSGFIQDFNYYLSGYFKVDSNQQAQILMYFVQGKTDFNSFGVCNEIQVENCSVPDSISTCSECNEGFYLGPESLCILNPTSGIPNCSVYSDSHTCEYCEDGYHKKGVNQCAINQEIQNCVSYSSSA